MQSHAGDYLEFTEQMPRPGDVVSSGVDTGGLDPVADRYVVEDLHEAPLPASGDRFKEAMPTSDG